MFKKMIFILFALTLTLTPFGVQVHAFGGFDPDWTIIQSDATIIHNQALTLEQEAFQMRQAALIIQQTETDPEILAQAGEIAALAGQIEQDAAAIAVTAEDINTRIDNSEDTTLALSHDIGVMADRIGEMADRILWTELQIGVMADRIVVSEGMIHDGTLSAVNEIQESNQAMMAQTQAIQNANADIQRQLSF